MAMYNWLTLCMLSYLSPYWPIHITKVAMKSIVLTVLCILEEYLKDDSWVSCMNSRTTKTFYKKYFLTCKKLKLLEKKEAKISANA